MRTKEDDCLILATDGLWDVMTNEEACAAARKRILAWRRKNGDSITALMLGGSGTADPAAQAAAEYLAWLAQQKGSEDNITVIVVDLRPNRRVKVRAVNCVE